MGLERNVLDVSSLYFGGAGTPRRFRCLEIESNRWGWGGGGGVFVYVHVLSVRYDPGGEKKSI